MFLNFYLESYTKKREFIEVPNFIGLNYKDAIKIAKDRDFKVVIIDSLYLSNKPRGIILNQYPEPNKKVKPERTIYFTINSISIPKVPLPDLEGLTLKQAIFECELYDLKIRNINYVPDISNTVINVYYENKRIKPKTLIPKGSYIDIDIGTGNDTVSTTELVCVLGLTLDSAIRVLSSYGLKIGSIITDYSIKSKNDSLNAVIWKQFPDCSNNQSISVGSYIDVWITLEEKKIFDK